MTLVFDFVQIFVSSILVFIYRSQRKDSIKAVTIDEGTSYLLHPAFEKQQEKLCIFAIFLLAISTIFIQTIIQAFILILILGLWYNWANDQLDKNGMRLFILSFA